MEGIMEESLVSWALNGVSRAPLLCTEREEEALLCGHLLTSGRVSSPARIRGIAREDGVWQVRADALPPTADPLARLAALTPNASPRALTRAELLRLQDRVMAQDHTAGLHAVLLDDGTHTVIGRDVGRHNALDKAVGLAVREGLRLDRAVLCSTGRLSLEMFAKAALAGIPILSTRKQVGSLAAAYAERLNITLCRTGGEPVCLTAPGRIL